jgi:hypothetical protein
VREPVGLRRESRGYRPAEAVGRDVLGDHLSNEVLSSSGRSGIGRHRCRVVWWNSNVR